MDTIIRVRLEMGARVSEFLHSHTLEGPGWATAVASFDALLTRATIHLGQQQEGATASHGATHRRIELRNRLRDQLLRYLVGVARVAAKKYPELADRFRLPASNVNHLTFVTTARRLLAEAETHRELLTRTGLEEQALDDIRKALGDLDAVDTSGHTARADHVGARADLAAVATDILDHVNLLEGMIRYRFADDSEVLAIWKSARKVPSRSARRRSAGPDAAAPPAAQEIAA